MVPDNLRSAVSSASRYEPDINPTYLKLAVHYGIAVVPARVRKPRDKSKVENAVLQVERNILARLREHTFHSLAEVNAAIAELLTLHNDRYSKSLGSSRTDLFLTIDRPELKPLPEHAFADGEWTKATVNIDYHVVVDRHRYSVPNALIGQEVDIHLTAGVVEICAGNERVASHKRSHVRNAFTTVKEHMPPQHRQAGWQQDDFLAQACKHGPNSERLIVTILASRPVPEQAYRSCLGVLRLADKYGSERMEAAALRAIVLQTASYKGVLAILEKDKDKLPLYVDQPDVPAIVHSNIRGAHYYGNVNAMAQIWRRTMLEHPTLDKLAALKLTGMLEALQEQRQMNEYSQLSFEERLGMLVDREVTMRKNRLIAGRMKRAALRQEAAVEDINFRHPRGPGPQCDPLASHMPVGAQSAQLPHYRPYRDRQELSCLRLRPEGNKGGVHRTL